MPRDSEKQVRNSVSNVGIWFLPPSKKEIPDSLGLLELSRKNFEQYIFMRGSSQFL